jgi:beta-lactamase class A
VRRGGPNLLRWVSITLLLAAVALTFYELVVFSRVRARLPDGMTIAGVPVGGLDRSAAVERLLQVYSTPVELQYGDALIHLTPAGVGFRLDTETMLAAAELDRTSDNFWTGFWDYLWNRPGEPASIPLRSEYSQAQLEATLRDIAARYDQPGEPVKPVPGSPNFQAGSNGTILDVGRAMELVGRALNTSTDRRISLPVVEATPERPTLSTLGQLLRQNVDVAGFDGLVDLYLMDMRTGEELQIAYLNHQDIPTEPGVAFTAASTIKIGIMVAYYRYFDEPLDPEADRLMRQMITLSANDSADWLMQRIGTFDGPLLVTDTMEKLGLESTFIAGYFKLGSELMRVYRTPGNQRSDVNTRPDVYNQTTASETGMLMADIYQCANGGGTLLAVFPGQITPSECSHMLDLLADNHIGVLIEAGVPEVTRVAHKHGWTESPLRWLSDVGVVYTPGGDYVLSVYLWNDPEMIWEPTSELVAELSRAAYNYFNPPANAG